MYQVLVGNIGTVYDGDIEADARAAFVEYRRASWAGDGRAAGEAVTLMSGGEPVEEYEPIKADDFVELVEAVRDNIADEYRASEDPADSTPGIQLTIGCDDALEQWSYQTGDNSYTGGAYHYPHWAVVEVYRDSDAAELAADIVEQLGEAASGALCGRDPWSEAP